MTTVAGLQHYGSGVSATVDLELTPGQTGSTANYH